MIYEIVHCLEQKPSKLKGIFPSQNPDSANQNSSNEILYSFQPREIL